MPSPACILLVDDEPAITESLAYVLGRSGFEAVCAASLAEADRALLATPDVDLIILDLVLPDGNGMDWLRTLRLRSRRPVIILSSHDDPVDHIVGLEIGADDYINKPFSPREVVARVRAVLRRVGPPAEAAARPTAAPLVMDVERRQAVANGVTLSLSKTEFDLLTALSQAPGRVFEREHLLEKVWGDTAVTERSVDAFIKSLRKKLVEAGLPAETIETVRGVGYRLAERITPG